MEDGKKKTKLCTEGATYDQSNDHETFNPLKLF